MSQQRRTRVPADTRKKLLQAAMQEFTQSGYANASIERIAARAGYTKGAFYSKFANKEVILFELLEERFAYENERGSEVFARMHNPDAGLSAIGVFIDKTYDEGRGWMLLTIEIWLLAARDREFGDRYNALYARQRALSAATLAKVFRGAGRRVPRDIEMIAAGFNALGYSLVLRQAGHSGALHGGTPGSLYTQFLKYALAAAEPVSRGGRANNSDAIRRQLQSAIMALTDGTKKGDASLLKFLVAASLLNRADLSREGSKWASGDRIPT